jgi:hypothetical protein
MINDRLNKIYNKTDGYCHICHKKLSFINYAHPGTRGSWEIEHSIAKANGGTDHLNNLFPACISCNKEKRTLHSRTVRARNGNTRAPYSKGKKDKIKSDNAAGGAVIGGLLGSIFGPGGAILGAAIGGALGNSNSSKK